MSRLKVFVVLLSLACAVLAVVLIKQWNHSNDLSHQLYDANTEAQLQLIVRQLAVPPEIIVATPNQLGALDMARLRLFREAGYPPTYRYDIVLVHTDLSRVPEQPMKPVPTTIPGDGAVQGMAVPYSERVMSDNGPDVAFTNELRDACNCLIYSDSPHYEYRERFHDYLQRNPKLFEIHIRPLLLRLSHAKDKDTVIAACRALYDNGDRSSELHDVLLEFVQVKNPWIFFQNRYAAFHILADLGDRSAEFRDAILVQVTLLNDAILTDARYTKSRDDYLDLLHECFPSATAPAPATEPK